MPLCNLETLPAETIRELAILRRSILAHYPDGSEQEDALTSIETFCAVALRIMAKTNPSKVRSEAMTVEIGLRMKIAEQGA